MNTLRVRTLTTALICSLAALLVQLASPSGTFLLGLWAVAAATWLAGASSGLLTTALCVIGAVTWSLPLRESFWWEIQRIVTFTAGGAGLTYLISSLRLANQGLQQLSRRFGFITDVVKVGTWEIEWPTGRAIISQPLSDLVGLPPVTTLSDWKRRVYPEDLDQVEAALRASREEAGDCFHQYRMVHPSGRIVWISVRGARAGAERSIGIAFDVTEQKQLEQMLKEREDEFRSLFEDTLLARALADPGTGKIAKANRAFCELTGYTQAELLKKTLFDVTHPGDRERALASVKSLLTGEKRVHDLKKRYLRKDGREVWARVTATIEKAGFERPARLSVSAHDLSEQKSLEDELMQRRLLFAEFAASNIIGIKVEGASPLVNDEYLRIVGCSRKEYEKGMLDPSILSFEDQCMARDTTKCAPHEIEFTRRDGSKVSVILGCMSFGPKKSGRLFFILDITQRKLIENELREAHRYAEAANRMKDEFLATVSHELRSPLNAILGYAALLAKGERSREEIRTGLETISRNAKAQAALISDLLDVSRIISGKLRLVVRRVELEPIVEAAISSIKAAADAKQLALSIHLGAGSSLILGDPGRLQQIVWNLLSNAAKFTPNGGAITVRLTRTAGSVELTVSDTGIGMAPEFLPYVFDRFRQAQSSSTRKYAGLGIGLSIVKHLVDMHGGTIAAESGGEGKGSTFRVTFPALGVFHVPKEEAERKAVHPEAGAPQHTFKSLAGSKVLVVDDEADARDLLRKVLEENGAEVETASSAEEGVSILKQYKADVLLSDLAMPGEDGFSLISRIRELPAEAGGDIPAAALTAYAAEEDKKKAILAGFQRHISKPVDPVELTEIVWALKRLPPQERFVH